MPITFLSLLILAIFTFVIVTATLEKLNKAVVSLIGAIAVYILLTRLRGLSFHDIIMFEDFSVLITIIGIAIIVEVIREAGIFQYIAIRAVKLSRGDAIPLYVVLAIMTFVLSAFTASIATIIIMGTLTIAISRTLRINPTPYLVTEAILVDVGGMIFMFSSLPNIILAEKVGLSPSFFIVYIFPYAMLSLLISLYFFYRYFRHTFEEADIIRKTFLMEFDEWVVVKDRKVFVRSALIFLFIICGFFLFPHELALVALGGGIALLVLTELPIEEILGKVDWETVFFFAGIFIIVGGLEHEGLLEEIGKMFGLFVGNNVLLAVLLTLWLVGLLSGLIDNIPITIAFIPVIQSLITYSGLENYALILWASIVIATNVGGNLIPYGSPTTVLMLGISRRSEHPIRPREFMNIGIKWTILHIGVGTMYIVAIIFLSYIIALVGLVIFLALALSLIVMLIVFIVHVTVGIRRFIDLLTETIEKAKRSTSEHSTRSQKTKK